MIICRFRFMVALALISGFAGTAAFGESGVSKDKIVLGQVAVLEGPAQALGRGMREGILAAFEEANGAGGIAGRKARAQLRR